MDASSVPPTPFKRAQSGRRARKSEEQLAKSTGGLRQPASGSKPGRKGDVRENGFLTEDKFTDNKSYSITQETWYKIEREAAMTPPGLRPRMRLSIKGLPRLCVMLEDDYLYMAAKNADTD
jgi:hypothetical protein